MLCPLIVAQDSLAVPDTTSGAPVGNAVGTAAKAALNVYRVGITDTETHNCPMKPSCSGFAVRVLKKAGPLKALLLIADRLIRDNSFAKNYYERGEDGLLIDPVDRYLDWEKKQRPY